MLKSRSLSRIGFQTTYLVSALPTVLLIGEKVLTFSIAVGLSAFALGLAFATLALLTVLTLSLKYQYTDLLVRRLFRRTYFVSTLATVLLIGEKVLAFAVAVGLSISTFGLAFATLAGLSILALLLVC